MFLSINIKKSEFLSENFQFLVPKFSIYLNRHFFVMINSTESEESSSQDAAYIYFVDINSTSSLKTTKRCNGMFRETKLAIVSTDIHYENTPNTLKISPPKIDLSIYLFFFFLFFFFFFFFFFSNKKNYDSFHISAQNIDCGYSLEPPRREN